VERRREAREYARSVARTPSERAVVRQIADDCMIAYESAAVGLCRESGDEENR